MIPEQGPTQRLRSDVERAVRHMKAAQKMLAAAEVEQGEAVRAALAGKVDKEWIAATTGLTFGALRRWPKRVEANR